MSTSQKREVALDYANMGGSQSCSIVFEIQMGMIDRGADLSWLSQYSHEKYAAARHDIYMYVYRMLKN